MKKKLIIIGSTIGVMALITGILLYTRSTNERQHKNVEQSISSIQIGKTYGVSGTAIKLLDETHYVAFEDDSSYSGGDGTSPSVSFDEGTYHKEGETYIFDTQTSVLLLFLDKEYAKNKAYFDPKMSVSEIKKTLVERKVNIKGFYKTGTGFSSGYGAGNIFLVNNMDIPNSMDEFLSQYHYEPLNK